MISGDILLEIDSHRIRTVEFASAVCRERHGQITVAMISLRNDLPHFPEGYQSQENRPRKARDLFAKV